MRGKLFTENYHVAFGKNPVADFANGTMTTDVVNTKNFDHTVFLVYWGVGTTGTTTLTVEACDDAAATTTTAIPFRYRIVTGLINAGDTHGSLLEATASGVLTTAGSHQCYIVEVRSEELGDTGYGYIRLKGVEGTASAILGGVLILQGGPRFDTDDTTLT
jgi:hypothetical protein